ncbi:MAG: hypothetical protein SCARUB_00774 [Candidatus Scalindua rubra]|uniref:Uncharacterized protein n=1 Tax=Candidatus Scalindua rubra TaxID=1872076 RepID=A0A1E3XEM7_9BACT|nr:MAG: hypothetical protein SCARUB_00774 [Candidatus Scalindua rubra]
MKRIKNINIKSIVIIIIVSCLSFGLGFLSAYKINMVNDNPVSISKDNTDVKMLEEKVTPNSTNMVDSNEEDPLMQLKLLMKDVETFRALMEEVKNELLVSNT